MGTSSSKLSSCSRWLSQRPISLTHPPYSIAIDVNCPVCQPPIAHHLVNYLSEFGDFPELSWQAFDSSLLQELSTSPFSNRLGSNVDEVSLSVASLGGAILEGPNITPNTAPLPHIFQVCLACKSPTDKTFHLHLNQKLFERRSLISVVADSFLEWVASGGDPANHEELSASDAQTTLDPLATVSLVIE